jgi:drug/metabolite transporter (DMT)-like permease
MHGLTEHWRYSLLLAAINPTSYYLILFSAYDRLPAQVAQPINFTWAIVLSIMSAVFLKQKLTRWELAGLLGGYCGVAIITTAGYQVTEQLSWVGLGLVIISTLLWASFWLLNTRTKQAADIQLWQNFLLATPSLILLALVTDTKFQWHWEALASAVYIGVFEMGLAFLLWQRAIMLTQHTARISTLIFLAPIISLFLISLVLKEPLQLRTFIGLGLILAGVWLAQSSAGRKD